MHVAWNMSARKTFAHIASVRSGDALVLWVTFLLTIFINLTTAVQIGILLAAFFFLKKMTGELETVKATLSEVEKVEFQASTNVVHKYVVSGPIFFGTAVRFEDTFPQWMEDDVDTIIVDMAQVSVIDATGEAALSSLIEEAKKNDIRLVFKKVKIEQR